MAFTKYSVEFDNEKTARSQGHELHVSPRHCVEICRELRGKSLAEAKSLLEGITKLTKPVPFKRHSSGVGHRAGLSGWDAGRFPQKAARDILTVLKGAEANAEYKGLDTDRMRIVHSLARRGRVIEGRMPRAMGRATAKNTATVTVEIVLQEFENGD
ncbi:MAG: 50S ribosomal protein L22 [Halobacteriota archaeon]